MSSPAPNRRWVKLILRISKRVGREIVRLFQLIYVFFLVIPVLSLRGLVSTPFSVARGYESILIFSIDKVIKIATFGKSTIENEYRNYVEIMQLQPALAEMLPQYSYFKDPFYSCLVSERLYPVPIDEALTSAVGIRVRFDNCVALERRLNLEECPQIQAGLKCVEVSFGEDAATDLRRIVEEYLATGQYHVGLSHGDFHSRNIMRDRHGCDRIIDLDCVRFLGVVELDALYFALEMNWSNFGALWTSTLAAAIVTQGRNITEYLSAFSVHWNNALGAAYFLDRVGQEFMNYGFRYTKEQMVPVFEAINNSDLIRNRVQLN